MFEITVKFTSEDLAAAEHLESVIADIAPYMVDNVDVTLTSDEDDETLPERVTRTALSKALEG